MKKLKGTELESRLNVRYSVKGVEFSLVLLVQIFICADVALLTADTCSAISLCAPRFYPSPRGIVDEMCVAKVRPTLLARGA